MKYFAWDEEKNKVLKEKRNVSFNEVVRLITKNKILDTINHPNQERYPKQKIYILEIHNYCYFVPFIEKGERKFLKTIIPSRKLKKKYLQKNYEKKT